MLLAKRALGYAIDESWVDWAVSLLVAGYDTPSLRILAGMSAPFDVFEMNALADRVVAELGLHPFTDPKEAAHALTTVLCQQLLAGTAPIDDVLRQIKNVSVDLNLEPELGDFSLLYWARSDLIDDEIQWYWDGATRENIDEIVRDRCRKWLADHRGSA